MISQREIRLNPPMLGHLPQVPSLLGFVTHLNFSPFKKKQTNKQTTTTKNKHNNTTEIKIKSNICKIVKVFKILTKDTIIPEMDFFFFFWLFHMRSPLTNKTNCLCIRANPKTKPSNNKNNTFQLVQY